MVLNIRFRGTVDFWDPLFLHELAKSFVVIIFDYTGLGGYTGNPSYNWASLVKDLGFDKVVIGGWWLGGFVAQKLTVTIAEPVS